MQVNDKLSENLNYEIAQLKKELVETLQELHAKEKELESALGHQTAGG
jgi:hypothetical protein